MRPLGRDFPVFFIDKRDRREVMSSKVTYRQQFTRCGKQRCRKCREGEGHGPYWYAYWSEKGRTVSKYVGIELPMGSEAMQQPDKQEKDQIHSMISPGSAGPLL